MEVQSTVQMNQFNLLGVPENNIDNLNPQGARTSYLNSCIFTGFGGSGLKCTYVGVSKVVVTGK